MATTSSLSKPKPHRLEIKRGRRLLGEIVTLPSGVKVFHAKRKVSDIIRNGEPSIAEAVRKNLASWALEDEMLLRLRVEKVAFVLIDCKDIGDRFTVSFGAFLDPERKTAIAVRSGMLHALPFHQFKREAGRARL